MISSISNSSQVQRPMQPQSQPLTDEQKETVNSILASYDSASMSEADVEAMRAEFKDAGIKPSEDLKGIMEEAGFEVPERSGPEGAKGGGKSKPPEFAALMEKLQSSDVSEDDLMSFIESIQAEKGSFSGAITDDYA